VVSARAWPFARCSSLQEQIGFAGENGYVDRSKPQSLLSGTLFPALVRKCPPGLCVTSLARTELPPLAGVFQNNKKV